MHGKAILYGYITLVGLMLICTIMREIKINIFSNFAQYSLCVMLSLVVCEIIMIKNDTIDGIYDNYAWLGIVINSVTGFTIMTSAIIRIIRGCIPIILNGMLTDEFSEIIIDLCLLSICAAYFIKKHRAKKTVQNED